MKVCTRCKLTFSNDCFTGDRSRSDGRFPWCRACCSEDRRARYARDPKVRERTALAAREWCEKNPERRREVLRANTERHRERYNAGKRRWALANAEKAENSPSKVRDRAGRLARKVQRAALLADSRDRRAVVRADRASRAAELASGLKRCTRCEQTLSLASFNKHREATARDDRHPWCRRCLQSYRRLAVTELRDSYVRGRLAQGAGVPASFVPQPLVELKRSHLRLTRELNQRREK